jgi:hypothetical protein
VGILPNWKLDITASPVQAWADSQPILFQEKEHQKGIFLDFLGHLPPYNTETTMGVNIA